MSYFNELRAAMKMLGERGAIFLGQSVGAGGTSMVPSWDDVPMAQRIEFPVAEDLQIGTAIGLALAGELPICCFPRWNFMLRCADGLVNHLDRLPLYSDGGYRPKVLIRVAVPSTQPFNPGQQHDDDFTAAFRAMLRTVDIVELRDEYLIVKEYRLAAERETSTILVEYTDQYRDERAKQ